MISCFNVVRSLRERTSTRGASAPHKAAAGPYTTIP
jgi:hypothetical protein